MFGSLHFSMPLLLESGGEGVFGLGFEAWVQSSIVSCGPQVMMMRLGSVGETESAESCRERESAAGAPLSS